jgi:hypothetical protein
MELKGGSFANYCQVADNKNASQNPLRNDFDGDESLGVGGVIVPLAAFYDAIGGYVAALVILPEKVCRCWHQCAGGGWLATVRLAPVRRAASGVCAVAAHRWWMESVRRSCRSRLTGGAVLARR